MILNYNVIFMYTIVNHFHSFCSAVCVLDCTILLISIVDISAYVDSLSWPAQILASTSLCFGMRTLTLIWTLPHLFSLAILVLILANRPTCSIFLRFWVKLNRSLCLIYLNTFFVFHFVFAGSSIGLPSLSQASDWTI